MSGQLSFLQHGVLQALLGKFPVAYGFTENETRIRANSPREIIEVAKQKIAEARNFVEMHRDWVQKSKRDR